MLIVALESKTFILPPLAQHCLGGFFLKYLFADVASLWIQSYEREKNVNLSTKHFSPQKKCQSIRKAHLLWWLA